MAEVRLCKVLLGDFTKDVLCEGRGKWLLVAGAGPALPVQTGV